MFETSFLLFIKVLLYNIALPLVPGILFLWICFGKKNHGMLLYLLGWFVGVGVVAFSLFNLQFIHFGIGIGEYFIILGLLLLIFVGKLFYKKLHLTEYVSTLKIKNIFPQIRESFLGLSKVEKVLTWIFAILSIGFLIITLVRVIDFPTYADDSFGNWNGPAYNIYQDGGVKIFGDTSQILGRGVKLGYPIYIAIYKAQMSFFIGSFDDIYINFWQWLVFFYLMIFVFYITFSKTRNIFYSLLPVGLIISLPLVFFHSSDGYMELPCAAYSILTIWAFWKFLEGKDYDYLSSALLFGFILSNIKNDGLLGYFAGIFITFVLFLLFSKQFLPTFVTFVKKKISFLLSIFYAVFFFVPFLFIKSFYHLGFNQSVSSGTGLGISSTIHLEIFPVFKQIFFNMDNYNVILIIFVLMFYFLYLYRKRDNRILFLFITPIVILLIFILVFLLTGNYVFVMDQTTVNRVFSMSFLILLAFTGLFFCRGGKD